MTFLVRKVIKFLKELELSPLCSLQRDELIRTVGTINSQLVIINAALDKIAQKDDDVQRMISIPHIGTITALTIKAWAGDFHRFSNASKLVSYAGLAPSVRQSGNKEIHGHITKQGPSILRATLVQAAAGMRPSDGSLYTYYQEKAKKIGVKRARIALAKKLLTIAYRVVVDKTAFVNKEADTTCHKCSA